MTHPPLFIRLLLVFTLVLGGCSLFGNDPQTVLGSYLDARLAEDYKAAYSHLASPDKADISEGEYIAANSQDEDPFGGFIRKHTQYTIEDVQQAGNLAQITVHITMPDVTVLFGDMLRESLINILGGDKTSQTFEQELEKKYAQGDVPMVTLTEQYNLVKEADGWYVDVDLQPDLGDNLWDAI